MNWFDYSTYSLWRLKFVNHNNCHIFSIIFIDICILTLFSFHAGSSTLASTPLAKEAGAKTVSLTIPPLASARRDPSAFSRSATLSKKSGYISTSLGTTYHKGAALHHSDGSPVLDSRGVQQYGRVADTYDANRIFQANTVIPNKGANETITYQANVSGAWKKPSSWSLSLNSQNIDSRLILQLASSINAGKTLHSGNFSAPNGGAIKSGTLSWPYVNQYSSGRQILTNSIFASGGSTQELVNLLLTDNRAKTTFRDTYCLKFHKSYENIIHLGSSYLITSDRDKIAEADSIQAGGSPGNRFYIDAPKNEQYVACQATEEEFKKSCEEETQIRSGKPSIRVLLPSIHRMADDYTYDMALHDEKRAFCSLDGPLTCKIVAYWYHWKLDYSGDLYGAQGYIGSGYYGSTEWKSTPTPIYIWTLHHSGSKKK